MKAFGDLLRTHRVEARLSQEQLADRAEVSAQAVSALETGTRRRPYATTVAALSDALGLTGRDRDEFRESSERGRAGSHPAATEPEREQSGLPGYPTSFVGRSDEIVDVLELVQGHRLVTITGAGGVGKTRLVVQVAQQICRHWEDGASFVDLASVRDPALVPAKIASALDATLGDGDVVRQLAGHLRSRHVLLILDNCEHMLSTVADIVHQIVRDCPRVTIIATSRERLGLAGEAVFRVPSLAVPDDRVPYSDGRWFAATALFLDRAASADRAFVLDEERYRVIVDICRRLDGIPLAIELAAARLPALGLFGLREQLHRHFGILASGNRDLPERQRTMLSTIAWSYAALERHDRVILRRLAVFAGGFTLDAAETICADSRIGAQDVVLAVASLVDKSLVVPDFEGLSTRYRLLESTRAFAWQMFVDSSDFAAVSRHHAEWLANVADDANATYLRMSRKTWMGKFEPWLDNARAALTWALGPDGDAVLAGRIVGGLRGMWRSAGLSLECRRWATSVLEHIDADSNPEVAARSFRALAQCTNGRARIAAASRAEELLRGGDDHVGLASSLIVHAQGLTQVGEFEEALSVVDSGLAMLEEHGLGQSLFSARALYDRGTILRKLGRTDEAAIELAEALAIAHAIGDEWISLDVQVALVEVQFDAGNVSQALVLANVALDGARKLRWEAFEISILNSIATCCVVLQKYDEAANAADRALFLARDREPLGFCLAIQHLSAVAAVRGRMVEAARLLGFADASLQRESYERPASERVTRAVVLEILTKNLEGSALRNLMTFGASLTEEAAIAQASSARAA
jgi:predicted ATPase/transcriptional regulator with XRE-family HTH domain